MEEDNSLKILEQTATEYCSFDDKMTFIRLGSGSGEQLLNKTHGTLKIEGLVILLVTKGSLSLTYNRSAATAPNAQQGDQTEGSTATPCS